MITNLVAFSCAALMEITGCFMFWLWLRDGRTPLVGVGGAMSLVGLAKTESVTRRLTR